MSAALIFWLVAGGLALRLGWLAVRAGQRRASGATTHELGRWLRFHGGLR